MVIDQRYLHKKRYTSILNSRREINVSIFVMFAFCSLTDRLTGKSFVEYILIYERNVYRKNQTSILIIGRENRVTPKRTFMPFVVLQTNGQNIHLRNGH